MGGDNLPTCQVSIISPGFRPTSRIVMATYRYPVIAREGWSYIALTVCLALVLHLFSWKLALPAWLATAWLLLVFRDPPRDIPARPLGILSPVDGKVLSVEQANDPYLKREALRIVISMRWFDVYSLRSPTEGKVVETWLPGSDSKSDASAILWIQTDEKDDVVTSILGGFWLWKPMCETRSGERVGQGARCGFMRFGSKVELMLPKLAVATVKPGDVVTSGESVIANLIHER